MPSDRLPEGFDLRLLPPRFLMNDSQTEYENVLCQLQRFRGEVYLNDGAIPAKAIDHQGRHAATNDEGQWHLFIVDTNEDPVACIRLTLHVHNVSVTSLKVYECVSRMQEEQRGCFVIALNEFIDQAKVQEVMVGEVGGWAVKETMKRTTTAVILPLAAWSVSRILGPSLFLSTATKRHSSAEMLKRMGGTPLYQGSQPLPSYFDSYHGCEIELVVYRNWQCSQKYEAIVELIRKNLINRYPWSEWLRIIIHNNQPSPIFSVPIAGDRQIFS